MTDEKDVDLSQEVNAAEENAAPEENAQVAADDIGEASDSSQEAADPVDDSAADEQASAEPVEGAADDFQGVVNDGDPSEEDAEAAMLKMLEDLPQEDSSASPEDIDFGSSDVSGAEFQQLSEPASNHDARNIDILMDVDLPVAIELGRTKMAINEILSLGPGSVVELNKLAGEPVDLLVNGKIVARGEVVVVDENFGLRLTQLLTPEERLHSLAEE